MQDHKEEKEMVDATGYFIEWCIDHAHGYVLKGYEIFVPSPYSFTATYGSWGFDKGLELRVVEANEAPTTQSPTWRINNEPLVHENIKVPKE